MIASIDCVYNENDNKIFKYGIIAYYKNKKIQTKEFYEKKEMYNEIIEMGIKEAKNKKNLVIYANEHYKKFISYANITDQALEYYSHEPCIIKRNYSKNESKIISEINKNFEKTKLKPQIHFYDIFTLFGENIEDNKHLAFEEIKKEFGNEIYLESKNKEDICKINAIAIIILLKKFKELLKKDEFSTKMMISAGQISANYHFKKMKKTKNAKEIFADKFFNRVIQPNEEIMALQAHAGRGGRFEAFNLGEFKNATQVDFNSAYSYAEINIEFPNLKTLHYVNEPLQLFSENELFEKIGISKVVIYSENPEKKRIGLVPIRYKDEQIFPDNEKIILIGSYTHQEIKFFKENGLKILKVFYSIYYDEKIDNPLKEIIPAIYELRKRDELSNRIYKKILNHFTGKLKQRRKQKKLVFRNREDAKEMEKEGFHIKKAYGNLFLYEKESNGYVYSKYYMAQVYADITAKIRIEMTKLAMKIDKEDLIYMPCDSLIFKNAEKYKNMFNISNEMGCFKYEVENGDGYIYSKQQYQIKDKIKVSGVIQNNQEIKQKEFSSGKMETKRMINIFKNPEKAGTYETIIRNLDESEKNEKEFKKEIEEKIYIVNEDELDEDVKKWIKENQKILNNIRNNENIKGDEKNGSN